MFRCVFAFFVVLATSCCEEYKTCSVDGVTGVCIDIRKCPTAIKDLKLKIRPKICTFIGFSKEPIICCLNYVEPAEELFSPISSRAEDEKCAPLRDDFRPKSKDIQQGHKAWAKCIEYQDTAVFPCQDSGERVSHCPQPLSLLIGGEGIDAQKGEFPHMALLGYGLSLSSAQWLCGGSLISERFILTAAHCVLAGKLGAVNFAAMGVLQRSEPEDQWDIYNIKTITIHPDYRSPSKYHDIALLGTDRDVQFRDKVFPACLHVGDDIQKIKRASATGWGALGHNRAQADTLQDVPLWRVSDEKCSKHYQPHRLLLDGYNRSTQMCFGDDGYARDTCPGDSGGPLQIKSPDIFCMYLILGVTSFGDMNCATVGSPGIYTRVEFYIPWIESVVWP